MPAARRPARSADAINAAFGSFDNFKTEWGKAGAAASAAAGCG